MGASLESGNRGVAALGASLIKLVSEGDEKVAITFLLGRKAPTFFELRAPGGKRRFPVINYRLTPRAPLGEQLGVILLLAAIYRWVPLQSVRRRIARHPWFRAILEADWVGDIRGGDSFSDIYGLKRFVAASLAVISVIWVKGGIVLLPQTCGPFSSRLSRVLARYILHRATVLLCRDSESLAVIESLTRGRRRGRFCPDVAFALDSLPPDELQSEPPLKLADDEILIGLNPSGLLYYGGYNRNNMFGLSLNYREFLRLVILRFLADARHRILIIPHTFAPPESVESDLTAGRKIRELLPETLRNRVHLVTSDYDQSEIKGVIGRCQFLIGSRMHACIAALSQGIPAVGVAYSRKFHGVFDSVGAAQWVIDGRGTTTTDAVEKCLALFRDRHELGAILARNLPAARQQLNVVFSQLLNVTGPAKPAAVTGEETGLETADRRQTNAGTIL